MNKTKRMQIRFTPEEFELLQETAIVSGLMKKARVVRSAIKFFRLYTDMTNDGWELQFKKGNKTKTIKIL